MRRVFAFDVLACPRCGVRLRLIALLEASAVTARILQHLGRQLTSTPAVENFATWSPDGRRVLYTSDRGGSAGLYQKDANAGAADPDDLLLNTGHNLMPFDWSRDGRFVLYSEFSGRDCSPRFWILPTVANSEPAMIRTETPIKEKANGSSAYAVRVVVNWPALLGKHRD